MPDLISEHATYPDLAGRTALVTGGSRGIGFAVATALARSGAHVVLADISGDVVASAERLGAATGARAAGVVVDVTDEESVTAAFEQATALIGAPTVLVNSAGISMDGGGLELRREQLDRVMAVNVTGTFLMCRTFARACVAAGARGSIVNLASMSARIVNVPQQQSAYNASKAAVEAMTRSLAVEWLPHGIRVNAVSPGYILTDMTRGAVAAEPDKARAWIDRIPLGEMGTPDDVAAVAAFLASDQSRYVVGQSIVADGGYTLV